MGRELLQLWWISLDSWGPVRYSVNKVQVAQSTQAPGRLVLVTWSSNLHGGGKKQIWCRRLSNTDKKEVGTPQHIALTLLL